MSVNLDDSLTDLFSDENDAFFENPLQITRHAPKSNVSARLKRIKSNDNLFGITEEDLEQDMSQSKPTGTSTPLVSNDEDVVVTDDEDLGFDPKKPKETGRKLALFDDILTVGVSDTKYLTPTPATRRNGSRDERRSAISRQSTETTTDNSNAQRPKTSTGRRGSSLSNAINPDPLGLFSQPVKELTHQSARKRGTTADWLGLNAADTDEDPATPRASSTAERHIESPKSPRIGSATFKQDPIPQRGYEILKINETLDPNEKNELKIVPDEVQNAASLAAVTTPGAQSMLKLNAMNMETRNTFALLQQQEPQLTMATQMKVQERALLDMQRKQDALLQQQERQFQSLLQQQMQRQQHLEESIKLQQQRINAHIQLMLTQPATAFDAPPIERPAHVVDSGSDEHQSSGVALTARTEPQATTQAALDLIQIETDIRRLELEKQRLEELVANMQAKYEREIEMIETTHKKQLEVLDEHTAALETRLRAEIAEITEHYKGKLKTLEDEHQEKKANWESQISSLRQDYDDELRRIRRSNEDNLDMLREEHKRVLESIQRSKLFEFAIVQDNNNYLDILKAASANLTEATSGLQGLREDLYSKLELANKEKQQELDTRERRMADKERRLQLIEASAEQEKTRLMKLVSTLEQQLSSLSKESNEENWQLRLKLSALEADKVAFEREREYVREQLQRDEKRLADLRERQVAEVERLNIELQEERRQLQMDKIKFETEKKLRSSTKNIDRERCELDAAIKCAQDATHQADAERQRYIAKQQELDQRKRELVHVENDLRTKQEKLKVELNMCYASKQEAEDAAQRARRIEQKYQEKLQALQSRIRELAEKESFLAEERKLLAQQRIAIKETQSKGGSLGVNGSGPEYDELKTVAHKPHAMEGVQNRQENRASLNLVDRLLDDNIAESMQRMHVRTPPGKPITNWADNNSKQYLYAWPPLGLDDDSKSLVLNSNFDVLEFGMRGRDVTEL